MLPYELREVPLVVPPVRLPDDMLLLRTLVPVLPERLVELVDAREPAVLEGLRELELIEPLRVLVPGVRRTPPVVPGRPPRPMLGSVVERGP